ncbi:MAG: DNA-binding protein [Clostridium sp.]|nr:DNA-binding protein [Clostridium sp.]
MDYRRFQNQIFVRLDRGEEIVAQLKMISEKEQIKLGSVNALGSVNDFTVGVFDTEEKKFYPNQFIGAYEITNLFGTITTKDGEYYSHLHMMVGDKKGQVFGGHLIQGVIAATCEMIITIMDGSVEREYKEEFQTNMVKFL